MQDVQKLESPEQFTQVELQLRHDIFERYVEPGHSDTHIWADGIKYIDAVFYIGRQLRQELLLEFMHCLQGELQNTDTKTLLNAIWLPFW